VSVDESAPAGTVVCGRFLVTDDDGPDDAGRLPETSGQRDFARLGGLF
jgi:hypothetical protein